MAWKARKKAALASNKYPYTYVIPPFTTQRMAEVGVGAVVEEVGDDGRCSHRFSLYVERGKERGKKKE